MIDLLKVILAVGFFGGLIVFIVSMPKFIRRYRLSKIAKKYGLSFEAGKTFFISTPTEIKKNILKGMISGHKFELYDSLITYNQWIPLGGPIGGHIPKRCTLSIIDDKREVLSQWIGWYASVSKIEKIIRGIN